MTADASARLDQTARLPGPRRREDVGLTPARSESETAPATSLTAADKELT